MTLPAPAGYDSEEDDASVVYEERLAGSDASGGKHGATMEGAFNELARRVERVRSMLHRSQMESEARAKQVAAAEKRAAAAETIAARAQAAARATMRSGKRGKRKRLRNRTS